MSAATHMATSSPRPSFGIDISVLERTAEDLSSAASRSGSDIGEEIRKMMVMERERSRSRSASQNSLSSSQQQPQPDTDVFPPRRRLSNRSRATSNSYANSVSDARLGITSPTESVRSAGSAVNATLLKHRMHSFEQANANTTRQFQFEPTHEPLQEGRPLDSPQAPSASIRSGASMYSSYSQEHFGSISRRVSQSSMAHSAHDHGISRHPSQSSFAQRYDQIAGQIEEQLQTIPHTPEPEQDHDHIQHEQQGSHIDRPHSTDTFQEAELAFKDFDGVHFNPDTEEYVAVDEHGNEVRRISARTSSGSLLDAAQMMRARPGSYGAGMAYGVAPPEPGMVYYPAPVPRMLNLPKRLSQLPAASAQARRRTQILNYEAQMEAQREPAPYIPKMEFDETAEEPTTRDRSSSQPEQYQQPSQIPRGMLNQRMSMANLRNLPPQLRASAYFDHPPVVHDIQVKHESAVATLDSILAASATAPVSAFTDHPFAGDVRKSVYAMEKPKLAHRKSTATLMSAPEVDTSKDQKKKRTSSIGNFFRRSSGDLLVDSELKRPGSRGSQILDMKNDGGNKLQKRKSQLSLADQLERERTLQDLEGHPQAESASQSGLVAQAVNTDVSAADVAFDQDHAPSKPGKIYTDGEQIAEDFREQEALSDVDDNEPIFAQPSTLLAELQVRKAQLKNRTRTAAVAYPNGMHSTLLQLDAVEQINKQKRQKQRIALAWEDPHQRELEAEVSEEDDVPLGVLYPSKEGARTDPRRPLGLMEQRTLEDNEPLSRRAERLNPDGRVAAQRRNNIAVAQHQRASQMHLAAATAAEDAASAQASLEEETLGQRSRRLSTLNGAISDVVPKAGERPESTFSADVLSQFGGLDVATPATEAPAADQEEEEETLGQRRARLRATSGENASAARPALRSTHSMANLLNANPVRAPLPGRKWEAQGLLAANAVDKERQRAELRKSSSIAFMSGVAPTTSGIGGGLANVSAGGNASSGGLLSGQRSRPANGAFVYNGGAAAGVGFVSPTAGAAAAAGYGPPMMGSPSMPMMAAHSPHMPMMMGGWGQPQQQMGVPGGYPYAGTGMMGAGMPATYSPMMNMPQMQAYGMGMGMGMGMEADIDPARRAAIDRWRMGIA